MTKTFTGIWWYKQRVYKYVVCTTNETFEEMDCCTHIFAKNI